MRLRLLNYGQFAALPEDTPHRHILIVTPACDLTGCSGSRSSGNTDPLRQLTVRDPVTFVDLHRRIDVLLSVRHLSPHPQLVKIKVQKHTEVLTSLAADQESGTGEELSLSFEVRERSLCSGGLRRA
jgi:hypothetical protein